VLQNEKYIGFAEDNTVEVYCLGRLDEAFQKLEANPEAPEKRQLETYTAKDADGNPVTYMKEWAGMTKEHLFALARSKGSSYNDTGKIPFLCIVDPWTEKEMERSPGGLAVGALMEHVAAQRKVLISQHGPSVSRSVLKSTKAEVKRLSDVVAKDGVAKTMKDYRKLEKAVAKQPESITKLLEPAMKALMDAATAQLDDAEAKVGEGDLPGAKKLLDKLGKSLDGTELEARAKELQAKVTAKPKD
jgi:hypothetical protein